MPVTARDQEKQDFYEELSLDTKKYLEIFVTPLPKAQSHRKLSRKFRAKKAKIGSYSFREKFCNSNIEARSKINGPQKARS